jgi:acyl-CoA dehydrogenase
MNKPLHFRARETISRFVHERCIPLEDTLAHGRPVPDDLVSEMRQLRLFGLSIPHKFGGLDLGLEEETVVSIELSHASPEIRWQIGPNVSTRGQAISRFGSEQQKRQWLPRLASGEISEGLALINPAIQPAIRRITAVRDGGDYVLNGCVTILTNVRRVEVFVVMALDVDRERTSVFIVPRAGKGVTIDARPLEMTHRLSQNVCDLVLINARLPEAQRIGAEGDGQSVARHVVRRGGVNRGAVCVGIAERLVDEMIRFAREPGRLPELRSHAHLIANSKMRAAAARAMVLDAARRYDQGESFLAEMECAKLFSELSVGLVARSAMALFGRHASEQGIERFTRGVRQWPIDEITIKQRHAMLLSLLLNGDDSARDRTERRVVEARFGIQGVSPLPDRAAGLSFPTED